MGTVEKAADERLLPLGCGVPYPGKTQITGHHEMLSVSGETGIGCFQSVQIQLPLALVNEVSEKRMPVIPQDHAPSLVRGNPHGAVEIFRRRVPRL